MYTIADIELRGRALDIQLASRPVIVGIKLLTEIALLAAIVGLQMD